MIKFPKLNANILDINIKNAISKKHTMTLTPDKQSKDRIFMLNDGKKVIVKGKGRLPVNKSIINKVYSKLPDNRKVPIVFQSKKSYLQEYIKNQELKHKVDFPKHQEQAYIKKEMQNMRPIVSRYTTQNNKYMEPRTVFFTDVKWSPKQFKLSATHEVGHEEWERNKKIRKDWRAVNKSTSPTGYGSTNRQEDFAESYMLHKMGKLKHPKRKKLLRDIKSLNRLKHFTARNKYNDKTVDLYYATLEEAKYKNPNLKDFREVM